jgi:hypothetical protein
LPPHPGRAATSASSSPPADHPSNPFL